MAQRAIIGINGELAPFDASLDKIRTPGIGASSVTWVPDADTRCTTLRVTANGTYNAAQRGDYGYDYVTVSVSGTSVTGRDPDTGEEVQVGVDPDTGEIVETVLATEIRVTTPPTKTSYVDGESIDYSGIVVHAFSATGTDMGEVPFNELVFPETTADAQKTDGWSDGQGLNAKMLYYTPKYLIIERISTGKIEEHQYYVSEQIGSRDGRPAALGCSTGPNTILATRYNNRLYLSYVSGTGGQNRDLFVHYNGEILYGYKYTGWRPDGNTAGLPNRKQFVATGWEDYITDVPESTVDPTTVDPANLHAVQSLPVQWSRTGDGAVLETSFDIQVTLAGGDTP